MPASALAPFLAALLSALAIAPQGDPAKPRLDEGPERAAPSAFAFDRAEELAEFEVVAGSWSVSGGSLWCTSKGAREELRWRRRVGASGSAAVVLEGAGRVALALSDGATETRFELDRAREVVLVESGERRLLERPVLVPARGPIRLSVSWTARRFVVRAGEDEPLEIVREEGARTGDRLSLLSLRSQPRFESLEIRRDGAPARAGADASLGEELRLAVEAAAQELARGEAEAAYARIAAALPPSGEGSPPAIAAPVAALLQEIAVARPALAAKEPLRSRIAAATVAARDGSATIRLPLRPGWMAEAHEIVRTDGRVLTLRRAPAGQDPAAATSDAEAISIEIHRYDRNLEYWFGRDPRLVRVSGGGGPTLGRARADEQESLREKPDRVRPFERSALELSGETTYEYEISWPDPERPSRRLSLRELFVLRRGNTWRVSIEQSALSRDLDDADVDWILAGLRFSAE